MTSEMFIERYPADLSSDISALITFELDNVKDFSARSTSWSKTIVLPGSERNNKLFGHIFEVGQSNDHDPTQRNINYNFNAARSAACIIFQDQIQTFKGVLRLLQVNITQGRMEYEVAVFGEINSLSSALTGGLLTDLDFSDYDHVYNAGNITASWDASPGSGIYYPLLDYGTASPLKHNWDIRTFRPALYVKEYIDKMFEEAGFRYSSALFDTTRFKKLIVPHNQKKLTYNSSNLFSAEQTDVVTLLNSAPDTAKIPFDLIHAGTFTSSGGGTKFTYNGVDPLNINLNVHLSFTWMTNGTTMLLELRKNGVMIQSKFLGDTAGITVTSGFWFETFAESIVTNDYFEFAITVANSSMTPYLFNIRPSTFGITSLTPVQIQIAVGDTVVVNDTIPKNVSQIEFFLSIIHLFNLYVYEDPLDSRLIHITPYVDFYDPTATDSVDWTYKLNRDKTVKIRPMSEINAKKYNFKYKPDTDYYNDLYKKRYNEGYGDYLYDSTFEFAQQNETIELIFSPTPLVGYTGEEKIYPTIFKITSGVEENVDSNIRILQTKKITGVASWSILDGVTTLDNQTNYGYAGHFDDPDAPTNDLNFGNVLELFFVLVTGDLSRTQFNVYWSSYMAEITDKDSKLLDAWFYLNASDIFGLDFSKKISVDGVLFRLNSVKDYNASNPTDCAAELLKINYLIY